MPGHFLGPTLRVDVRLEASAWSDLYLFSLGWGRCFCKGQWDNGSIFSAFLHAVEVVPELFMIFMESDDIRKGWMCSLWLDIPIGNNA